MSEHRAKPADLCMADAMPFQQHHEYRTTLAVETVLQPRFFLDVRSNLRAGDAITICRFRDRSWQALIALAEVRVVAIGSDGVALHLRGQIETMPTPAAGDPSPDGGEAPAVAPRVRYAGADWRAEHKGFGRWSVLDGDGREVAGNLDKETAAAIVRGDAPAAGSA